MKIKKDAKARKMTDFHQSSRLLAIIGYGYNVAFFWLQLPLRWRNPCVMPIPCIPVKKDNEIASWHFIRITGRLLPRKWV
jgi:hypothetical protein